MDRGDWIQVYSGKRYFPMRPSPLDVNILDIAHALSMMCRFGGHCRQFYSVAEHSVWVSLLVPPKDALHGLLHDASEAYCVDVPRPVKHNLSEYAEIEEKNWRAVCKRFHLSSVMPKSVRQADDNMLMTEKQQLLTECTHSWAVDGVAQPHVKIKALSPPKAKALFLDRFEELTAR